MGAAANRLVAICTRAVSADAVVAVALTVTYTVESGVNDVNVQVFSDGLFCTHVSSKLPPVAAEYARAVYDVMGFHAFDTGASHVTSICGASQPPLPFVTFCASVGVADGDAFVSNVGMFRIPAPHPVHVTAVDEYFNKASMPSELSRALSAVVAYFVFTIATAAETIGPEKLVPAPK